MDPDSPFRNLSSETPDGEDWHRTTDGDGGEDDPLRFYQQGCLNLCVSTESQEEADACAERQALLCVHDNEDDWKPPGGTDDPDPWQPPGPGGNGSTPGGGTPGGGTPKGPGDPDSNNPPGPDNPPPGGGSQLKPNAEQTCSETCPDGSVFSKTVAAGEYLALTQTQADAKAYARACQLAKAAKICLGDLSLGDCCVWHQITNTTVLITGSNAPYTVEVSDGQLPTGLNMISNEAGTAVTIGGTPTTCGVFTFSLKATDQDGNSNSREYTVSVVGITQEPGDMSDGLINTAYSYGFSAAGPLVGILTWSASGLPDGLTINSSTGAVGGTPTEHGAFLVSVTVRDQATPSPHVCTNLYNLYIFDCTVDEFTGTQEWELSLGTGPIEIWYDIPVALCSRPMECHSITADGVALRYFLDSCTGQVIDYHNGWSLTFDLYNHLGQWQGGSIAASVNPFSAGLGAIFTIPPNLRYRCRIVWTPESCPPLKTCCSKSFLVRITGI